MTIAYLRGWILVTIWLGWWGVTMAAGVPNGDFSRGLADWRAEGGVWHVDAHTAVMLLPDDRLVPHYATTWDRGLWAETQWERWGARNANMPPAAVPKGRLISSPFRIDQPFLLLQINGNPTGSGNAVGVDLDGDLQPDVLLPDRKPSTSWDLVTLDLRDHLGETGRFVVIAGSDKAPGGWEPIMHIAVGQLRLSSHPGIVLQSLKATGGTVSIGLKPQVAVDCPYNLQVEVQDAFSRIVSSSALPGTLVGGKPDKREITFTPGIATYYRALVTLHDSEGLPVAVRTLHMDHQPANGPRHRQPLAGVWEMTEGDYKQTAPPAQASWEPVKTLPQRVKLPRGGHTAIWFGTTFERHQAWESSSVLLSLRKPFRQLATMVINGHPCPSRANLDYDYQESIGGLLHAGVNTLAIRLDVEWPYLVEGERSTHPGIIRWGGTGFVEFSGVDVQWAGPVRVTDIFPMTFVSRHQLVVQATVVNESDLSQVVQLAHQVHDPQLALSASRVPLPLRPWRLDLAPGETRTLEIETPWPEARLWDYEHPNLYRLHSEVWLEDGTISDASDLPFGFRELGIAGGRLTLNGQPVRLRKTFRDTAGPDGLGDPARVRNLKRLGYNCVRGYQPHDLHTFELDGFLYYRDFPLAFKAGALDDPAFWSIYNQICADIARGTRTSPSLVLHSVTNEMIHSGEAVIYPDLAQRFRDLTRAVHAADRTRIVVHNGDLEAEGFSDTINYHYVHDLDDALAWPNQLLWLGPNVEIPAYNQATAWTGYKPLLATEVFNNGTIHSVAHLVGERAFLPGQGYDALLELQSLSVRALDAGGISGHQRWRRGIAIDWLDLLPLDETRHLYGGHSVQRRIALTSDFLHTLPGSLTWTLRDAGTGRRLVSGASPLTLPAGITHQAVFELALPTVETPTDCVLDIAFGGAYDWELAPPHAELHQELCIYPADPVALTAKVALIDPRGVCANWATQRPQVQVVQAVPEVSPGMILLIAPGASPSLEGSARALADFANRGGQVLCLEQEEAPLWSPVPLTLTTRANTQAFKLGDGNPLTDDLTNGDLRFWQPANWVMARGMLAPQTGSSRILIGSGSRNGLDQGGLVEVRWGQGRFVFCQLLVGSTLGVEPLAGRLLDAWLNTMASERLPSPRVGLLVGDRLTEVLATFGVMGRDLAAEDAPSLDDLDLVIIDAPQAKAPLAPLQTFVANGGRVWLHGLTPECLERWRSLLPEDAELATETRYQLFRTAAGPAGLSMADLYGKTNQFALADYNLRTRKPATEQVAPGALVDSGNVLVDLIHWEAIDGASGPQARHLLAALLAWQGVAAQPVAASDAATFTSPPVTGNRSLTLVGPDGWLGQGSLDLSDLPAGEGRFARLPIHIGGRAAIASADGAYGFPASVTIAEPGQTADDLVFLLTSAYGFIDFDAGKLIGEIRLHVEGGIYETIPLVYGPTIGDWTYRAPEQLTLSRVAWQGKTVDGATPKLYLLKHHNPYPDRPITRIELVGLDTKIVPIVVGVSLASKKTSTAIGERRRHGDWSVSGGSTMEAPPLLNDGAWWSLVAPWMNVPGENGSFRIAYGPEQLPDPARTYTGLGGAPVSWRFFDDHGPNHQIRLDRIFPTLDDVLGYGLTFIHSPKAQDLIMVFGSDDDAKVWLNDELVHQYLGARAFTPVDRVPIHLKAGWNPLLVKCIDRLWGWCWQLYFVDQNEQRIDLPMDVLKRLPEVGK